MKKLLLFMSLVLMMAQSWAQTRTVTGKITDAQGKPVASASVTVKGGTKGTLTKDDGSFSLEAPINAKIVVISSVGFATQEIPLGNKYSLTVTLQQDDASLGEVVITGYSREKKSQFTGSAVVLSGKVVEEVPVGSFDQALQGRAPGMLVNSGSGQPGSSANVTIRGISSISGAGAQPLYVLDGVPIPAGDFQTLNPNDFESLTVLKDAGAAALYGARGGTGVIVITTKKGKAGTTRMTARSQLGITKAPNFDRLNIMNTDEILQYEERLGAAQANPATVTDPGWTWSKNNPTYATASPTEQANRDHLLDSVRKIHTDIPGLFYRNGLSQSHELNMSGGSDKTKFYLSTSMFDQKGIDRGSELKRYIVRLNLEHTVNKFTVQWNTSVGYSKTNYSEGEALGNSARNPFQMTYRARPYDNPYKADGTLNYGTSSALSLKQLANVMNGIENSSLSQNQVKINTGLTAIYKLFPFLALKNTFGVDFAGDMWQRYINPNSYIGTLTPAFSTAYPGLDQEATKYTTNLINTSSALFNKKYGKHDLEVGAYFEVVRNYQKGLGFTLYNLDPRITYTGQGAGTLPTSGATTYPQYATSAKSGYGIRSYFATARYTYDDKYTISANIRRDGTSRIANDANKEITTWSAGATWNVMRESFMDDQKILTDLKVRASYGIVPNISSITTGSYNMLSTSGGTSWVNVTNYTGPQQATYTASAANSYPDITSVTGSAPSSPGNPNLKIEHIKKANIGVDFAVWQNRAHFSVDVYKNMTVDMFVSQPLPSTSGLYGSSLSVNAGKMSNKGIEWTASVDVVKTRNYGFTFTWNHAINVNKIEDLGLVSEYPLGTFLIQKGLPYGTHYTPHYLGADPTTGAPRFETTDGKVTNDPAAAPNFAKYGTYMPKHVGGFTLDFRYKGFSISTLFSYQMGVVRSNNIRNWITRGTVGYQASVNGSKELLTRQWQKPGDNAWYQGITAADRGFTSSDLENAKFLRFRTINVSYQIPAIAFRGNNIIKGAKVYAQMQNVAVWSPWTGLDPEDNNNISLNEYPNPKMITAGVDINF